MTAPGASAAGGAIRIDRLLVYLRFARTRSAADALIAAHALRRNRKHVLRGAEQARIGDILTIAMPDRVRVIELLTLPDRRGSPALARTHYREVDADNLDPKGQMSLAPSPVLADVQADEPEDPS